MTKKKPAVEDEEQSRRFIATATELEATGDLDLDTAEVAFNKAFDKAAPPKTHSLRRSRS